MQITDKEPSEDRIKSAESPDGDMIKYNIVEPNSMTVTEKTALDAIDTFDKTAVHMFEEPKP